MTNGEFVYTIEEFARQYRLGAAESVARNKHMNDLHGDCNLYQDQIDAILVDFINFVAMKRGMDLGLYTKDFRK